MENFNRKQHWEKIYNTKQLNEVSWYQPTPSTSLKFVKELQIPPSANIIDIGGGDSFLVDHLLEMGFEKITVLDISEAAIERAKTRLGDKAKKVNWIVADAADFNPTEKYDFWHDRAAFHFLTEEKDIEKYIAAAHQGITSSGIMVIGTFSENGPKKCSGIEIMQYSHASMVERFAPFFEKINCTTVDHTTPSGAIQNFTFCSFRKK